MLPASPVRAGPIQVDLGTASSFAVLGGAAVTNTGSTVISGNLGVWPSASVSGFPPGLISTGTGSIYSGDATAQQAQSDLTAAYIFAAAETGATDLTGQNLGGMTLTSGVYSYASSAGLTGVLTLNAQGDSNAVFIFQIGDAFNTATGASVVLTNGGEASNVFFQVGSSATLETGTSFNGNILALTSITLDAGATIGCGAALARNGTVALNANVISVAGAGCGPATETAVVPEPGTAALLGVGLMFALLAWRARPAPSA